AASAGRGRRRGAWPRRRGARSARREGWRRRASKPRELRREFYDAACRGACLGAASRVAVLVPTSAVRAPGPRYGGARRAHLPSRSTTTSGGQYASPTTEYLVPT